MKVGKDPRSHLRVDDEFASRMHAVIEVASSADITLIDLGNESGTLVNGQRVNKCKVRPGDQIQIGSALIVLETAEVAAAASQLGPGACALGHELSAATLVGVAAVAPTPAPSAPAAAPPRPFASANPFAARSRSALDPFAG
ncbi:MAG: FHA domain-containing protein, partial [Polyangiaceae bacterium]